MDTSNSKALLQQSNLVLEAARLRSANQVLIGLAAVLAGSVALYLWGFNFFQVGIYRDDAEYVLLSRSILTEAQFGLPLIPGQVVPSHFPFGWPLFLAPLSAMTGGNIQALKLAPLLLTLVNTALIALAWSPLGLPSRQWGLAVAALYAFAPLVTDHARMLMSEPAFTCWVLLGLVLTTRVARRQTIDWAGAMALGVVWMLAVSTRSIGVVVLATSALYLLYRRKLVSLVVVMSACAVAVALVVLLTVVDWRDIGNAVSNPSYATQVTQSVRGEPVQSDSRVTLALGRARNMLTHVLTRGWRDLLIPFAGGGVVEDWFQERGLQGLLTLASALVSAAVILGYMLNVRQMGLLPVHLYMLLYLLAMAMWPWVVDRLMYPILPFLLAYLAIGTLAILQLLVSPFARPPRGRRLAMTLAAVLFTILLSAEIGRSLRIDSSLNHAPDLEIGATWIRDHTERDAVVITTPASSRVLYLQRAAVEMGDSRSIEALVGQRPVYALIAPSLEWHTPPSLKYDEPTQQMLTALESGALGARLVFEDPAARVRVYRLSS